MPIFENKRTKQLKQRNSELEEHARKLTSEIQNEESLHRSRESEMEACEQQMQSNEQRAQKADAARQEARTSLVESMHALAVRKGEEEAQYAEEVWAPHLLAVEARARHIAHENVVLEEEVQRAKHHSEECQQRLQERGAQLQEGASKARNFHGAFSTEISRSRTRLAALHLQGSQLEARHAEEVSQRDKLVRKTEEGERLLEIERREGERLSAELLRLRNELRGMDNDYWESLPYIDVGTDLSELKKLQAVEQKSADRAAMLERQLRAERGRRQAIGRQGKLKCDEFRKRIVRLRQTNGASTSKFARYGGSQKYSSDGVSGDTAQLDLASPTDLDFSQEFSMFEGSRYDSSSSGQELGHSRTPGPLQDSQQPSPSPISLRMQDLSPVSQFSPSDYARGPNKSLLTPGMHYF